jgi:hypothetical protein
MNTDTDKNALLESVDEKPATDTQTILAPPVPPLKGGAYKKK